MTAAFLQLELTNLISESRRKHVDVKTAAEKSLTELRSIAVTSETQLAGDLIRKASFIDPFLLACKSQNAKLASNGAACLQRLVASTAIPRSRLSDLLQAFEEAVSLALEVQLKILQTLPSLLQLYAADIHGEALSRTLSVSADLSSNKLPLVSSTASATFQQLLAAVFAKATSKSTERPRVSQQSEPGPDSRDAFGIFIDLCALLAGGQLNFVRLEKVPPSLILETLESLLSTYGLFILGDDHARGACINSLVPGLAALIESSVSYPVVVRAFRITFILASQYLPQVEEPMADLLMIVLRIADRGGNHKWKRVLGLEFCRGLCSNFEALRSSYAVYDMAEHKVNFVSDLMASLVRTASEDPSLIGLGRQSSIPTSTNVENNSDSTRIAELPGIGGSVGQTDLSAVGLSAQGSTLQTPCLDQYDRTSAPTDIPDTYIFTLVLGAISAFSDGLSKFIMPLSVPNRKSSTSVLEEHDDGDDTQPLRKAPQRNAPNPHKYQQLVNPLSRTDSNRFSDVAECAKMIESCWPAILATCSTFLNAALDSYFYHMLIRAVQKLTQVSGVLELNTPRDAFLTTLAKVSVPANVSNLMNSLYGGNSACDSDHQMSNGNDLSMKSPVSSTPRQSIDLSAQSLNVRNLLCLRALLNLGIALGPTLSASAWTILWQSLEQVEALMSVNPASKAAQSGGTTGGANEDSQPNTLAAEISAVDTARRRMIESTSAYSESAFTVVCKSLFEMIANIIPDQQSQHKDLTAASSSLRPIATPQKSTRSVSGGWAKATTLEIEVQFVMKFIGRLASVNLHRFKLELHGSVSWDLVVATLSLLQSNARLQTHLRLQCANIIDAIVVESCSALDDEELEDPDDDEIIGDRVASVVRKYSIPALERQLDDIQYHATSFQKPSNVEIQTVLLMLQALHNVVSTCGEDLHNGWDQVFTILNSVTSHHSLHQVATDTDISALQMEAIAKLYSAAFKVTHLIASDFLSRLSNKSLSELTSLFAIFGSQQTDLNMSLTTIALYWDLAALIGGRVDHLLPFTKSLNSANPQRILSEDEWNSSLWQSTILALQSHCKDPRSDSRNAAVRMLAKIIETSLPQMSSKSLNSYYSSVSLPLLDYYSKSDSFTEALWKETALRVLQDLVRAIESHATTFIEDSSFRDTWSHFMCSTENLLRVEDVVVITTTFDALTKVVQSLCQSDEPASFIADADMLETCWNLWLARDPTGMKLDGQNQDAFASYARFLLAMTAWNFKLLSTFNQANQKIGNAVDRLIYNAVHEAYTVDVNKVSVEQEQALRVLDVLKDLNANDQRSHILHLLLLARNLVKRSTDTINGKVTFKPIKGTRQPTGIAFATICIEKLQSVLQLRVVSDVSAADYPFPEILETCAELVKTKYSSLPTNGQILLWEKASQLATTCMTVIELEANHHGKAMDAEGILSGINLLLSAVIEVPNLESKVAEARPSTELILTQEEFDITQLHVLHKAAQNIFLSIPKLISQSSQKEYVLTIFHHSLVARPWYNDLPPNLAEKPLDKFTKIRPGSIRAPDLPIRRNIYPEALHCLFSLVARTTDDNTSDQNNTNNTTITTLSSLAAPYILLRLAHTLKSFLADQPLRHLQHPHTSLQHELHIVLRAFIDLRVSDHAFTAIAEHLELNPDTIIDDGKTHLRIMTGLLAKFEKLWRGLPRLKRGLAWQDYEDGRGVEACLGEWRDALSQGVTVEFE